MTPPYPTATPAVTAGTFTGPHLVEGQGELSGAVTRALRSGTAPVYAPGAVLKADPWGEDLQLSLHLLYELHYRGFDGVDGEREWDPDLLRLRQALEARFLHVLRTELSDVPRSAEEAFAPLLVEPVDLSDSSSARRRSTPRGALPLVHPPDRAHRLHPAPAPKAQELRTAEVDGDCCWADRSEAHK
ncbi:hypothetical protein ACFVVP_26725 [Streptomyces sp. NPDC058128]|uniref:hypothetical protein n=1 Tax=Streptomyces sp. NPDC058128 TaxID=3346352 RepID=UPI0036E8AC4E